MLPDDCFLHVTLSSNLFKLKQRQLQRYYKILELQRHYKILQDITVITT